MKRILVIALVLALAALVVAGCGSKKKSESTPASTPTSTSQTPAPAPGSPAGATLKLAADPSGGLKFDKDSLTAKAGKVSIVMDNPSPVQHAIAVEGNGVDKDGNTVGQGGKSSVSVTLKPGTYTFYCPVDSHKAGGMKGTLTVK